MFPIGDDLKMMLVVREDLKMGKGKIGAQCGHATLGAYQRAKKMSAGSKYWTKVIEKWSWGGQKKICLKVPGEADLLDIQKQCQELGLPYYLVADAGLTQIEAGSLTVCGIGPADSKQVNIVTQGKKLL